MTTVPAPTSPPAMSGRAIAAFARTATRRAADAARRGGATLIGASGLVSIAVGAGMVYLPAGLIVGGALAVGFAAILPRGDR